MPVLKTYINGSWKNVSGFGNNADTLDGKHASEFAPADHASPDTTYGIGTSDNYGHIKLSDATDSISGTGDGVAATPAAVKAAYDLANGNHSHSAMTGATSAKAGTAGFVPAPSAGKQTAFLRGDGTWATPESDGGVFIAKYNETTFAEINEAYSAGKLVICQINLGSESNPIFVDMTLGTATAGSIYAFCATSDSAQLLAQITKGGTWSSFTQEGFTPVEHTHEKSEITDFPTSMTPTAHNQAASTITAGTFAGRVQGNVSAMATISNAQFRDIKAGTADLTAGESYLATGTLYFVYE